MSGDKTGCRLDSVLKLATTKNPSEESELVSSQGHSHLEC